MICSDVNLFAIYLTVDHTYFGYESYNGCEDPAYLNARYLNQSIVSSRTDYTEGIDIVTSAACSYFQAQVVDWKFDEYYDFILTNKIRNGRAIYGNSYDKECNSKCCPELGFFKEEAGTSNFDGNNKCSLKSINLEGQPAGCGGRIEVNENNCENIDFQECLPPQLGEEWICENNTACDKKESRCLSEGIDFISLWKKSSNLSSKVSLEAFRALTFNRLYEKLKFAEENKIRDKSGTRCEGGKDACWFLIQNGNKIVDSVSKLEYAQGFLLRPAIKQNDLLKNGSKIQKEINYKIIIYTTNNNEQSGPCCNEDFDGEIISEQEFKVKPGEKTFKEEYYTSKETILYTNSNEDISRPLYACVKQI